MFYQMLCPFDRKPMVPLSTVLDGKTVQIGYVCSNSHLILDQTVATVKGIVHSTFNGEDCSGTLVQAYVGGTVYGLVCTKCYKIFKTDQDFNKVLKALEDIAVENKMPFVTLKQVLNRLEGQVGKRKVKEAVETLKELKYVAEVEKGKYAVVEFCGNSLKKVIEKYGPIFFSKRKRVVYLVACDGTHYQEKLVKKQVREAFLQDEEEKILAHVK